MPDRPALHVLAYGDSGGGKSSLADTFPNPKLVCCFDAFGKDMPYLKGRHLVVGDLKLDGHGTRYREVFSRKGTLLKRIEYYHDTDWITPVEQHLKAGTIIKDMIPNTYPKFMQRMAGIQDDQPAWRTVVLDSVTSMEIAARRWDQFVINPNAEDARRWYFNSKDLLERMLLNRFSGLPCNVVVLAHIDPDRSEHQGVQRRMPMAPGTLRASLPSQYGEVYRVYADATGHWLQTRSDNTWLATTQIEAPAQCEPHYLALWAGYDAAAQEAEA